MKKTTFLLGTLMSFITIYGNAQGTWTRKADFAGDARQDGTAFLLEAKDILVLVMTVLPMG